MTLQELLEHAHLDALAHLDEREQAAFEAAFVVAPPAIKAQIRSEQARWAPMDHLLPEVEPSPELRDRVLEAVTAAMIAQNAGGDLSLRPARRVAAAWRAASIGLMTAVIVLGSAFVYVFETEIQNEKTARIGQNTDVAGSMFRSDFRDVLLSSATRSFYLESDNKSFKGSGSLWTNPTWKQARIFLELPQSKAGEEYRVVAITGGASKDLDKFVSDGVLRPRELPASALAAGTKIAVIAIRSGEVTDIHASDILLSVTI